MPLRKIFLKKKNGKTAKYEPNCVIGTFTECVTTAEKKKKKTQQIWCIEMWGPRYYYIFRSTRIKIEPNTMTADEKRRVIVIKYLYYIIIIVFLAPVVIIIFLATELWHESLPSVKCKCVQQSSVWRDKRYYIGLYCPWQVSVNILNFFFFFSVNLVRIAE